MTEETNKLSLVEIRQLRAMLSDWNTNKSDLIATAEMVRSLGRFSKIIAVASVLGGAAAYVAKLLEVI